MDAAQILEELRTLAGRTQTELDKLNGAIACLELVDADDFLATVRESLAPTPEATPTPKRKTASDAATRQTRPAGSKYDYAEVAKIANRAARDGATMGKTVAKHFDVSDAMGSFLIATARKQGHVIGKGVVTARLDAPTVVTVTPTVTAPPTHRAPWQPGDAARRYGPTEGDDHDND